MPFEVIEANDPLTAMTRFLASPIYEMMISLSTLLRPRHHTDWATATRAALPPGLWDEMLAVYEPYWYGAMFYELAVDYPDHDDIPGFIDTVRHMDPATFVFYLIGRVKSVAELREDGLSYDTVYDALQDISPGHKWLVQEVPLHTLLSNLPAFQNRLADLWLWYAEAYFSDAIASLQPRWQAAIEEKQTILAREGGQGLLKFVTGKPSMPRQLPADQPVNTVEYVPIYHITSPVYVIFGYGNVTVLYDTERTEARQVQVERDKAHAVGVFKALGDNTRLDILRLIAHYPDEMSGKLIASKLSLSASAVSRHLNQFKDAGLIAEERKDNRTITYRLQDEFIDSLPDMIRGCLYH
ncbi:MAG: winged helix-turn-helix transcriptional regulator [Anaerolineae bacterium]|nr:winged helix-turn-helix transcriptional regulator [Anaerolineae bacterium]